MALFRNIMKFQHFFKVHQISSNLQNIYWNHHQKHACEIWAHSEKWTYFIEKCWQFRPFEISWNFNIFSKFTKFHQTCRTYLNHHQKHACEIWAHFREVIFISQKNADSAGPRNIMKFQHFFKVHQISSNLQNIFESSSETCMWNLSQFREVDLFHREMLTMPALWIIMKFQHFFKVHQISSNLQNLLESSSETCMWNLSQFREVIFFHRKMPTVPALEISWNFNIFSKFIKFHQTCSAGPTYFNIFSKFTKFHQTCNHHQKHACEIWAISEKLTYFIEKCWQCRP